MPKRILVTGKNGQLEQSLQKIATEFPQFDFVFVGRDELDLSPIKVLNNFLLMLEIPQRLSMQQPTLL